MIHVNNMPVHAPAFDCRYIFFFVVFCFLSSIIANYDCRRFDEIPNNIPVKYVLRGARQWSEAKAMRRIISVSNGQLWPGAWEKIPRNFADSVPLLNKIELPPLCVCWYIVCALTVSASTPPNP